MIRCPKCLRPHGGPRNATNLVAAITRVSHQMLGLSDEKARILLRLQLRILTAELDGLCQSCQWERAAQEHADAGQASALVLAQLASPRPTEEQIESARVEGAPGGAGQDDQRAEPGAPSCRVIPIRKDLGVRFRSRDLSVSEEQKP